MIVKRYDIFAVHSHVPSEFPLYRLQNPTPEEGYRINRKEHLTDFYQREK